MPRFEHVISTERDSLRGLDVWWLELHDPRSGITARAQVVVTEAELVTPTFYGDYPESVAREIRAMENTLLAQAKDSAARDTVQFRRPKYDLDSLADYRISDEKAAAIKAAIAGDATGNKVLLLL